MTPMQREISAGGVVLRQSNGIWQVALIEPHKDEIEAAATEGVKSASAELAIIESAITESKKRAKSASKKPSQPRVHIVLPKGLVDPGETSQQAAVREVREETGLTAEIISKIADNKYVYVRKWGDQQRVFKIVTFYLMRYVSGEIDHLAPEMRIEVTRAAWFPLAEAPRLLAYGNERKVLRQAEAYMKEKSFD